MSRQWMTLMAILLVYIPVAIDATVLHVAAPTLSVALGSSGNEKLDEFRHSVNLQITMMSPNSRPRRFPDNWTARNRRTW